jgi:Bacterial Ig-like domain (group 3)/FG-GAP-like repeat/FG-GAP repeat
MRGLRRGSLLDFVILLTLAVPVATAAQAPPLRFSKPIPFDSGGGVWSLAVGDVNGDGHLDVVVSYYDQGNVGALLGKGDGSFEPAVKFASGGGYAPSVAVSDVNGDGKLDIVVLNAWDQPGTVGVLLGNGDGTFQPPSANYTGDYSMPEALAVGDLNGDGHPDIAIAYFGHEDCDCNDGQVGIMWGNGDGTFQPVAISPSGGYDTVSISIVGGTWAVTNLSQCHDCDWPNGSVCWAGGCYDSAGMDPGSAAFGDLNGNGVPDIVVANLLANPDNKPSLTIAVMLDFGLPVLYDPHGAYPDQVAIADVNGDGKPDIVVHTRAGVGVLLGNGDGTFQPAVNFVGGLAAVADVNHDGKPDLVGTGAVMLNTSGFLTTTHITSSVNPSSVNQPVTFTATVASRYGQADDGELVTFYDHTNALASVPLAGGIATYTTSSLTAKAHEIRAAYIGNARLAPSTGTVWQRVALYPTTTKLTSAPNPSTYGQTVVFTATVASTGPAPNGKVKFFDYGGHVIGSGTVAGGIATLSYSKLLVGKHTVTAEYLGDSTNAKSISVLLTQVVQ